MPLLQLLQEGYHLFLLGGTLLTSRNRTSRPCCGPRTLIVFFSGWDSFEKLAYLLQTIHDLIHSSDSTGCCFSYCVRVCHTLYGTMKDGSDEDTLPKGLLSRYNLMRKRANALMGCLSAENVVKPVLAQLSLD
eukprot:1159296-Pelagomonas_calceolata.AAC.6